MSNTDEETFVDYLDVIGITEGDMNTSIALYNQTHNTDLDVHDLIVLWGQDKHEELYTILGLSSLAVSPTVVVRPEPKKDYTWLWVTGGSILLLLLFLLLLKLNK